MSHSVNFLHRAEEPERHRAHARRRVFRVAIWTLCALAAVWVLLVLFASGVVVSAALDGKDSLERARESAMSLDFDAAETRLGEASEHFATAEGGFLMLRTVRFVPWVSSQIEAADAMLVSGREVIDALASVVGLGGELVRLTGFSEAEIRAMADGTAPAVTFDDLSSDTKRAILQRLAASSSDLRLLAARIAVARADLSDASETAVGGPVAAALAPFDARLADAQETIRTLSVGADLLPEFAGLGEERTHLLLFMNNAELRPGGGFIGTYGILKTKDGDVTELETRDSYTLDNPAAASVVERAPAPLRTYNAADKWFFRDANWSPDFAASAAAAVRLYGSEINSIPMETRAALGLEAADFDGVIGMTPTFLQALLRLTGPLTVGGQTFDADNVTDKLEYQVEVGYAGQGVPESQRKDVVADLVNEIKSRLFSLPLSDWGAVVDATRQAFLEKQLVLSSADADTEELIAGVGWGGRVGPYEGDTQLVVDANLASLKSDPAVARSITYEVFRNTSGQYLGRTSIRYTHTGSFDWKTTRYRTYTQLYVPSGSELIRVTGSEGPAATASELGLTSFGAFIVIEPGESEVLSFEYVLADSVVGQIENGAYSLQVLKQVGAADHELTLDLDFDKNVTSASVPEDRNEWGDDAYRLHAKLSQDLEFTVGL